MVGVDNRKAALRLATGETTEATGEASARGLRAEGLFKSYRRRVVVRGASLEAKPGAIVGLLGPNGAGKTTLFRMIAGFEAPDAGRVLLDGRDITRLPVFRRARLGLGGLAQESSAFRGLSVGRNVLAALELAGVPAPRRRARMEELLEEFAIEGLRDAPASALSGGERRRMEVARALAGSPRYLLLDEPFAGVDPRSVAEMAALVRQVAARGVGVVITDHNVAATLALVDYAVLLYRGETLVQGDAAHVASNAEARRVYLGDSWAARAGPLS